MTDTCTTNTNNSKSDCYWDNSFFESKEEYDGFIAVMTNAAKDGQLPICLEYHDPGDITLSDIRELSIRFRKDTGLYIDFRFQTCNTCERLHMMIFVDEDLEEEGAEGGE